MAFEENPFMRELRDLTQGKNEQSQKPEKREWSQGLSDEVISLVDFLKSSDNLGLIVDCGAGEGRHSIYICEKGAKQVIAIEKDPEQITILKNKKEAANLSNLEIIEGDVLKQLEQFEDNSIDAFIDSGMSHFLIDEEQRQKFAGLIYSKLKPGGLYSITHFSEKEYYATDCYKANLDELKSLFPDSKWKQLKPWYRSSWCNKEKGGHEHHAYKAVLQKTPEPEI